MQGKSFPKTQRGLTLIELMVGLTIAAFLLMAAAPFFGDYIRNSRLRETMGMSGYFRVRDRFTFEAQARQYEKLFDELLAHGTKDEPYPDSRPRQVKQPAQKKGG